MLSLAVISAPNIAASPENHLEALAAHPTIPPSLRATMRAVAQGDTETCETLRNTDTRVGLNSLDDRQADRAAVLTILKDAFVTGSIERMEGVERLEALISIPLDPRNSAERDPSAPIPMIRVGVGMERVLAGRCLVGAAPSELFPGQLLRILEHSAHPHLFLDAWKSLVKRYTAPEDPNGSPYAVSSRHLRDSDARSLLHATAYLGARSDELRFFVLEPAGASPHSLTRFEVLYDKLDSTDRNAIWEWMPVKPAAAAAHIVAAKNYGVLLDTSAGPERNPIRRLLEDTQSVVLASAGFARLLEEAHPPSTGADARDPVSRRVIEQACELIALTGEKAARFVPALRHMATLPAFGAGADLLRNTANEVSHEEVGWIHAARLGESLDLTGLYAELDRTTEMEVPDDPALEALRRSPDGSVENRPLTALGRPFGCGVDELLVHSTVLHARGVFPSSWVVHGAVVGVEGGPGDDDRVRLLCMVEPVRGLLLQKLEQDGDASRWDTFLNQAPEGLRIRHFALVADAESVGRTMQLASSILAARSDTSCSIEILRTDLSEAPAVIRPPVRFTVPEISAEMPWSRDHGTKNRLTEALSVRAG